MYLGAHISIAGGFRNVFPRAEKLNAKAIQIFVQSSHRWKIKEFDELDLEKYFERKKDDIKIFGHTSYLVNLCSKNEATQKKSIQSLKAQLQRCEKLGINQLVLHPGSHTGQGEKKGLNIIIQNLNSIFKEVNNGCKILLENTSGQGTNLGYKFEHLAEIMEKVDKPERLAVCIDTCHMFSSGYDIRNQESYQKTMERFDKIIGTQYIEAFHLNDSKKELSLKKDRHENIGKGFIGQKAFELLINDKRFEEIPMTLETPGGEEAFLKDLELLRKLKK